jgi:4-deoxy-L-threo-5-hexosulose-uronate ketol-isomerase
VHHLPYPDHAATLPAEKLREAFLLQDLFVAGSVTLRHVDLDRVVLGGIVPTDTALRLEAPAFLASEYFTERRELGLLNVGAAGRITVDGTAYEMAPRDMLYVGRGSRDIVCESDDASKPARFYVVSYPAHTSYPTAHVANAQADVTELGTQERANRRRLYKYVHPAGIRSAQLVMGVTVMEPGNVWNTMPPHTHARRSEVYLYFDVPSDAVVVHLMGEPAETRNLIVRDREVVLSPPWSVHSGCGTSAYAFCWAMGGENQDFADMQMVDMDSFR